MTTGPAFETRDLILIYSAIVIVAGLPGAIFAGIVTWRRRRHLYGVIPGFFSGVLGALLGALAVHWWESLLPHHLEPRVFGAVRVANYPSQKVLRIIEIAGCVLGSALLGWLSAAVLWKRKSRETTQVKIAESLWHGFDPGTENSYSSYRHTHWHEEIAWCKEAPQQLLASTDSSLCTYRPLGKPHTPSVTAGVSEVGTMCDDSQTRSKDVAPVGGTVWKFVSCTHCQERYAYLLKMEATAECHDLLFLDGEGSARARPQAEQNLLQKSRNNMLSVPCPNCGFYQDEMSRQLKEAAWINWPQIAGAAIVLLSFIPLLFAISYLWVLTLILGTAGLAVLSYGYVIAFRFDPNAGDPEPRKVLGQKYAVWGAQLAELLAANANAEPPNGTPRR